MNRFCAESVPAGVSRAISSRAIQTIPSGSVWVWTPNAPGAKGHDRS